MTETDERISLLVVDDDVDYCGLLQDYLESFGYAVHAVHDGKAGVEAALSGKFDVVLLDVMLPGLDGFEVLRRIRMQSNIPALMLTARGEETDRIVGLEMGADDYVPKTFSSREMLARLRAAVRRAQAAVAEVDVAGDEVVSAGDVRIETASCRASVKGVVLELTPIEYKMLLKLAREAGRALTRDQLLEAAVGRDFESYDRSVDMHISSLRRKIGDDPKQPGHIKTVRGVGYMLIKESD